MIVPRSVSFPLSDRATMMTDFSSILLPRFPEGHQLFTGNVIAMQTPFLDNEIHLVLLVLLRPP